MDKHLILALLGITVIAVGCGGEGAGPVDTDPRTRLGLEALMSPSHPANNPAIPERVALGRLLFFDPILSGHGDVACATCHHPRFAWADARRLSVGVAGEGLGPDRVLMDRSFHLVPRNSPTILNTAYNGMVSNDAAYDPLEAQMFWDGRVASLEVQATKPIESRVEMRGDAYSAEDALDSVLARLRTIPAYEQLFRAAFIPEGDSAEMGLMTSAINASTYGRAIACFERSISGHNSPYDRFVNGDDDALGASEKRGLELFFGKANCGECHNGPMLADYSFRVQGVSQIGPGKSEPNEDYGRWEHTGIDADRWAFRTPTLRNVALTAPYMHDGALATLEDVVEFYDRGGRDHSAIPESRIDKEIFALGLTATEKVDLVTFMKALTDPGPAVTVPATVPSGLEPPR